MAQLIDREISAEDLAKFVEQEADFAFEMIANLLSSFGCKIEHSGYYSDPVTDRQAQEKMNTALMKLKS